VTVWYFWGREVSSLIQIISKVKFESISSVAIAFEPAAVYRHHNLAEVTASFCRRSVYLQPIGMKK
jgi:hypothetical protein